MDPRSAFREATYSMESVRPGCLARTARIQLSVWSICSIAVSFLISFVLSGFPWAPGVGQLPSYGEGRVALQYPFRRVAVASTYGEAMPLPMIRKALT